MILSGTPKNVTTGRSYSGDNRVRLSMAEASMGYPSPLWASYRQWAQINAQVRRGEHGTAIIYPSPTKSDSFKKGSVFNVAQVNLPPMYEFS